MPLTTKLDALPLLVLFIGTLIFRYATLRIYHGDQLFINEGVFNALNPRKPDEQKQEILVSPVNAAVSPVYMTDDP